MIGAFVFLVALGGTGIYLVQMQKMRLASGTEAMMPGPRKGRGGTGQAVSVGTAAVTTGNAAIVLTALGTVTPPQNVTVRTQIAGTLTKVAFTEGQMVKQGDFLAEVDPRPYENALAKAQGQLTKDEALLKEAESTLDRYRKLEAKGSLARQQLDTQASLVDQYKGSVQTDQATIADARLNLSYCHITAPIAGRVGLRQVDPGNYVQTSDTNGIVTLTQVQPISVLFALPEDNVPALLARRQDPAPIEVEALDRAQEKILATGQLAAMDNQVNTSTGTVKLRALFDNQDGALFPNQFVNVKVKLSVRQNVLKVPSVAVQQGQQGAYVYVVGDDKTAKVRAIKIDFAQDGMTVVTEGLAAGEAVVTDGVDLLQDGAKVSVDAKP